MNNLFNLPFAFSINPASVKHLLLHRKNVHNHGEDKWTEKAIRGLIKRLTKSSMVDDLEIALDTKSSQTKCVTIPRDTQGKLLQANTLTGTNKHFPDVTPAVAFCRIWRWPDLNTHLELKPCETCAYAFQSGQDLISLPPVYVPVSDRAVFDSNSVSLPNETNFMPHPDSTVGMDVTPPMNQMNSPLNAQDNYEAMTPTQASVAAAQAALQQETQNYGAASNGVANMNPQPINFVEPPFWCSILYYELNQRVGEVFQASLNSFVVDGYCDPNASDRFCLGLLTNVNRTTEIEACRRMIGTGVRLYYIGGEVFAECLSDTPIFVQSPSCNRRYGWHPATVCKIPPGCNLKIFNNSEFAQLLSETVPQGFESVYQLTRICSIRMSFVKGWGEEYRRRTIMSTPCWIEIHLNGPLQWLDRVLQSLNPPGPVSSK
ncbi:unnamed protein product [Didymodactylos carnosus]|uniref:Mothers against decapentaplegic homolog n=1 Tax=Didymodactylos carnosus TaxID=1234261 RepID=A0A814ZDI2_9BILA|nr:unnamed protein product [Didymodactylos carnosus]CAF1241392.1 unnamed protein product [Didymodactylos carnosus]CAF3820980.1 unnamed protein product [Didymodactylos carnosus]CAF4004661.1 unnamed protein product [Didymodactylos carnosus]